MRGNGHPEFVGVGALKAKHAGTLADFERWAAAGKWSEFHRHHYDWWMFPTDEPSSLGFAYTIFEREVAELRSDAAFLGAHLRGAALLGLSWGWDLGAARPVAAPAPAQRWQDWPVRLYKATRSLQLFGQEEAFRSFRAYGRRLLARGASFDYTRDIGWIFR